MTPGVASACSSARYGCTSSCCSPKASRTFPQGCIWTVSLAQLDPAPGTEHRALDLAPASAGPLQKEGSPGFDPGAAWQSFKHSSPALLGLCLPSRCKCPQPGQHTLCVSPLLLSWHCWHSQSCLWRGEQPCLPQQGPGCSHQ